MKKRMAERKNDEEMSNEEEEVDESIDNEEEESIEDIEEGDEEENDDAIEEGAEEDDLDNDSDVDEKEKLLQESKAYREGLERRGVIYMSRVPPFMKPNKARNLFEQYGEVTRLFLAEENAEFRRKRKEQGGNGSKQFREGKMHLVVVIFPAI
jgi:ESF2/ABP1 family protein